MEQFCRELIYEVFNIKYVNHNKIDGVPAKLYYISITFSNNF